MVRSELANSSPEIHPSDELFAPGSDFCFKLFGPPFSLTNETEEQTRIKEIARDDKPVTEPGSSTHLPKAEAKTYLRIVADRDRLTSAAFIRGRDEDPLKEFLPADLPSLPVVLSGAAQIGLVRASNYIRKVLPNLGVKKGSTNLEIGDFMHAGDVILKIGGRSIMDTALQKELDTIAGLRHILAAEKFLISGLISPDHRYAVQPLLEENRTGVKSGFPNMTAMRILTGTIVVKAFFDSTIKDLERIPKNAFMVKDEMVITRDIILKIARFRDNLYKILFRDDPPGEAAMEVARIWEKYSNQPVLRKAIRNQFGLDHDKTKTIQAYRACSEKAGHPDMGSFYRDLATVIETEIESQTGLPDMPVTLDQAMEIIPVDLPEITEIPWQVLRDQTNELRQYLHGSSDIDPALVDWAGISSPSSARITMTATGFELNLNWIDPETEESFPINLIFTTKKERGKFDWSVLTNPNDPESLPLKHALVRSAHSLLDYSLKQSRSDHAQKRKPAHIEAPIIEPLRKKMPPPETGSGQPSRTAVRAEVRQRLAETRQDTEHGSLIEAFQKEAKRILFRNRIDFFLPMSNSPIEDLLQREDVKDLFKDFPDERDRRAIIEAIQRYNLNGGNFKKVKFRENYYRLKVRLKGSRHVSVLVEKNGSYESGDLFHIVDIKRRAEAYRGSGHL